MDTLPAERIPLWAAFWIVDGYDGPSVVRLAGLSGIDPHDVRDVLPDALVECGVAVPGTDTAAALTAFTALAELHAAAGAGERWIVHKVTEIVDRATFSSTITDLPLGGLFGLDDEWGTGWGRSEAQLVARVREACREQLVLAGSGRVETSALAQPISSNELQDRRVIEAILGRSVSDDPWPPHALPAGTRVRVIHDLEWGGPWRDVFTGTIDRTLPPQPVVNRVAAEGELEYSVTFDELQFDIDGGGPYRKAVIWERYLEPI